LESVVLAFSSSTCRHLTVQHIQFFIGELGNPSVSNDNGIIENTRNKEIK
jgi:hypothetical protein